MKVEQRGVDTSGRPLRQSPIMWDWHDEYVTRLGFEPTMVKGGWQSASDDLSGPTHLGDGADYRTRDRTPVEVQKMIRVAREMSGAAWVRDEQHGGFDPHVHVVPGRWAFPSASAQRQWDALDDGRDGLASNGPDYHPYPLAPTWKADPLMAAADEILAKLDELAAQSARETTELKRRIDTNRKVLRVALTKAAQVLDGNDQEILDALAELDEDVPS